MKTLQEVQPSKSESIQDLSRSERLDRLPVTHYLEETTGKLPWVSWVGLSVASIAASAAFLATSKKEAAHVVGFLAPCFLLVGVYNKLIQIEGIVEREQTLVH